MIRGSFKVYSAEGRNKYVVVRQNSPGLMIYVTFENYDYEITRMNIMENCTTAVLCKVLMEFDEYFKREMAKRVFMDDRNQADIA